MSDLATIHRRFLLHGPRLKFDASALTDSESQLISRYGHWLEALANGRLQPFTAAQVRFVGVHRGELAASAKHELAWKHYCAEKLFQEAHLKDQNIGAHGYKQTVDMFYRAARMGSKRAANWLRSENSQAPEESLVLSLVEMATHAPVASHLVQDDYGERVDTSFRDIHDWGNTKDDLESW